MPVHRRAYRLPRLALGAFALIVAGCGVELSPETIAPMRTAYDRDKAEDDPLCIRTGPFPYHLNVHRVPCPKCEALRSVGFLEGAGEYGDGAAVYTLTELGRRVYTEALDATQLEIVRERIATNPAAAGTRAEDVRWPRMCFGRTRFHAIVDALAPTGSPAYRQRSVKIVAEVTDTSGLLFDPRLTALGLPIPQQPAPGEPILLPPEIVTFEFNAPNPIPWITGERYGAWVGEP